MVERVPDDQPDNDPVNHPSHYTRFGAEVIDITEHLPFNTGNAVKYLSRAGHKDGADHIEDLKKALWYTQREIDRVTRIRANQTEDGEKSDA